MVIFWLIDWLILLSCVKIQSANFHQKWAFFQIPIWTSRVVLSIVYPVDTSECQWQLHIKPLFNLIQLEFWCSICQPQSSVLLLYAVTTNCCRGCRKSNCPPQHPKFWAVKNCLLVRKLLSKIAEFRTGLKKTQQIDILSTHNLLHWRIVAVSQNSVKK